MYIVNSCWILRYCNFKKNCSNKIRESILINFDTTTEGEYQKDLHKSGNRLKQTSLYKMRYCKTCINRHVVGYRSRKDGVT